MSTGLLTNTPGSTDQAAALEIADIVATWWNVKQAKAYGFGFVISESKVKQCCEKAGELFERNIFPEPPGPFKRIATFLVLGRLFQFFQIRPGYPEDGKWVATDFKPDPMHNDAWVARMLVMTIPVIFSGMYVDIGKERVLLDEWKNFPSLHYRLEFMALLRWLDLNDSHKANFTDKKTWEDITNDRLTRMIMAVSLIIEACYYLSSKEGASNKIQSKDSHCLQDLDEDLRLDLYYDRPEGKPPDLDMK